MNSPGKYRLGLLALVTVLLELLVWSSMLALGWVLMTKVPAFRFDRPWMLWGMLGGPLLVAIFLLHAGWRNRALSRFATPAILPRMVPGISTGRLLARFLLLRHGLALVVLAMAGPQFGTRYEEVKAEGVDVVVALDVSHSMACEDVKPDRMEAARRAMAQLIDRLQGDRLGIVVFAGESHVQLPITADRSAAKLFLSSVDIGIVQTQGTAIGTAIDLARNSFGEEAAGSRVIIVITDGEDHEDHPVEAARRAAEAGIIVHTVGMGSVQGGPIPVRQGGRMMGFRKDRNGNTVVTRLNEDMLRGIAEAGNGTFVRGDLGSNGIVQLVDDLRNLERSELGTFRYAAHEDQFQYPLALGVLLILGSLAFGDREHRTRPRMTTQALVLLGSLVLSACGGNDHQRERALRQGIARYDDGNYTEAAEAFRTAVEDPVVRYDLGHALYRSAAWEEAISTFTEAHAALEASDAPGVPPSHALHDLGTTRLAQARHADSLHAHYGDLLTQIRIEGDDIQRKVELYVLRDSLRRERQRHGALIDPALAAAEKAFREALKSAPADDESRYNLAVTKELIAARRKERDEGKDDDGQDDAEKVLGERARLLIAQADSLVDAYRFREALGLLQQGLREDPTLEQKKEYMDKLETVTKAADAQ